MSPLQLCLSTLLCYLIFLALTLGLTAKEAVFQGFIWCTSFYVSYFLHSHRNRRR